MLAHIKPKYVRQILINGLVLVLTSTLSAAPSLSASSHRTTPNIASIEQTLKKSEAKFDDIVKGTEKTISWHSKPGQKTSISIVYVHGFSATHKELSPMTEMLAQRLQANVFYTRLTGHGRSDDAMAEATVEAWKEDIQQAYQVGTLLGDKVLMIGTSTGATLTTWLNTQENTNNLFANIMISPNFAVNGSGTWILKWSLGLWLVKQFSGDYRGFTPQNEFHAMYWTERYPLDALVPMLNLLDEVNDLDKSKVTTPQLIVYSPNDQVIDVNKALETAKEFSSAKVSTITFTSSTDPGQHVLVGRGSTAGEDYQEQVDEMLTLLTDYIATLSRP